MDSACIAGCGFYGSEGIGSTGGDLDRLFCVCGRPVAKGRHRRQTFAKRKGHFVLPMDLVAFGRVGDTG